MKLIYCAGPYRAKTAWGIDQNIVKARHWGALVASAGGYPIIPHSNTAHFDGLASDEFWLEATLELMRRCDAVLMTNNWTESAGSRGEKMLADRLGMPVLDASVWATQRDTDRITLLSSWIADLPNKNCFYNRFAERNEIR